MESFYKISYIDCKTSKHNPSKGVIRSLYRFWNHKIIIGNGNQILLTLRHAVVARTVIPVKSQGQCHFKGASWCVFCQWPWHNNGQNGLKHNNCSPKWPAIEVPVAALVMMLISFLSLKQPSDNIWISASELHELQWPLNYNSLWHWLLSTNLRHMGEFDSCNLSFFMINTATILSRHLMG